MPYSDPEKQRAYQREWMNRRRTDWLSDKSCAKCGSTEDLQVDHVDPGQKISHRIWSWSAQRRETELAKCQVLCTPCHKEKTSQFYRDNIIEHGTDCRYSWHECRCDACRQAHRLKVQRWRVGKRSVVPQAAQVGGADAFQPPRPEMVGVMGRAPPDHRLS